MDGQLNLYQKLSKIRDTSNVVRKTKQGYNYTYSDITDILASVTAGMKKYGVSLIPQIVPDTSKINQTRSENTRFDKSGNSYINVVTEMLFSADMIFTWVNDENPIERIDVPWFVTGSMSDPAQAVGAGLTYTTRQFLTSYFQIAQSDSDIDAYRSKQKEAEVSEERAVAKEIIAQFDSQLRTYLADNQDKKEDTKKFISRFAKNANYSAIKDPKLAAKLLNDFREEFLGETEE